MEEPDTPTRSDIWYSDGSIVLQAENVQFKVHQTVLAKHSKVFADMLAVGDPDPAEQLVNGCPLVVIQDSAEDVRHMLSILYNDRYA